MTLSSEQIREKFLEFFKARKHVAVPSSSLVPTDPSVLLTTAGVQQFKSYYTGQLDPMREFGSRRVVSIQKCFRTTDIDEVGDDTHLTFFEMLGNFCFGDYWKEEAIQWSYEFITKELGIALERVSVTIFSGNGAVPRDDESYEIWHKKIGIPVEKIQAALWDNFWGPTGGAGPCGPTTEIYIDGVEVWNIVFNEYFCHGSREDLLAGKARLEKLEQNGIDTGMGLERLTAIVQGKKNVFETDLFTSLIDLLPKEMPLRQQRIAVDHARGAAFLIADGIRPSNKDAGYVLRRLLRRLIVHLQQEEVIRRLLDKVCNLKVVADIFIEENEKFKKTLKFGLRELEKLPTIDALVAFRLYESYGLPYEIIKELSGTRAQNLKREDFDAEFKKHQDISRAGLEKKFGGHGLLLDTGELKAGGEEELKKVTRSHTATHLLQQALRDILGSTVQQRGSDITIERTRFDFSFDRKLTVEEIEKVETIVNQKIKEDLPVDFIELPKEEAVKTGALFFFKEKYPEKVKVWYVGKDLASAYSKEFCGGPHVTHTGEIGQFKILKEEAVGIGVRRIRAVVL